ncbi:MAG: hypothetical protein WAL71_08985, partial [Terriglobales bacterium]
MRSAWHPAGCSEGDPPSGRGGDQQDVHLSAVFYHLLVMKRIVLLTLFLTTFLYAEKTPFDLTKLKLPEGFHISVYATDIDSARMLTFTPGGVLLVSESGEGKVVALPDPKHTGKASRVVEVLAGLNEPHGIAFYEGKLYVAENDKIRRYDWDEAHLHASN